MERPCVTCGEPIRCHQSTIDKKKYCCVECSRAKTHVKVECIYCGVSYSVAQSRYHQMGHRYKCCSSSCYNGLRSDIKKEIEDKHRYTCTNCADVFVSIRNGKTSMKFCSQDCSKEYMRGEKSPFYNDGTTIGNHGYKSIKIGDKYVLEHRIIIEESIGRKLVEGEVVHHLDGDRLNNDIKNLKIMEKREHDRLHTTERHARRRSERSRPV